jgi:hypothetical protein
MKSGAFSSMQDPNLALLFLRPLEDLRVEYMVTGSVAAIIYGEPRLTHDLDLVVDLASEQIPALLKAFADEEYYCPPQDLILFEANREQRGHINLIHISSGFKADFYFRGRDPLHIWGLERARRLQFFGVTIRVAPAEYVIVRKLEYFREGGSEKHLRDIRLMTRLSASAIDQAELGRRIAERGLEECWRKVAQER